MDTNTLLVAFELVKRMRHAAEQVNAERESGNVDRAIILDSEVWACANRAHKTAGDLCMVLPNYNFVWVGEFLRDAVNMSKLSDGRYDTEALLRLQQGLAAELAKAGSYPSLW